MDQHVHLHCIVTGGRLALDARRWVRSKSARFLVDVVQLSAAYRDALCAGLRKLYRAGKLSLTRAAELAVEGVLDELTAKKWEVFSKPFSEPSTVYEYLSRYVHRVAIANHRLLKLEAGRVTFEYYDNRERAEVGGKGKLKQRTLPAVEFIRRLMLHILPPSFHRIRYFGLHTTSARQEKLPRCSGGVFMEHRLGWPVFGVARLNLESQLA